jgi:(S)-ureidoglycine aminohydrolase
MEVFGDTRSRLSREYALITPDTHVDSPLVGWKNATAVIHISPEMGARFTQYSVSLEAGATSAMPGKSVQRFVYVQAGECSLSLKTGTSHAGPGEPSLLTQEFELTTGAYAFIPASMEHQIRCQESAKLVVFEKTFQPSHDLKSPDPVIGHAKDVASEPFMGDEDAQLQTLLPIAPEFDMAVNIFTYQPGATLPQVEIHVMEHGLLMLHGKGVYRLSTDYYPVTEGDVIWMASYCPQWFVAMGKTPASYIYYKDIHRES